MTIIEILLNISATVIQGQKNSPKTPNNPSTNTKIFHGKDGIISSKISKRPKLYFYHIGFIFKQPS